MRSLDRAAHNSVICEHIGANILISARGQLVVVVKRGGQYRPIYLNT